MSLEELKKTKKVLEKKKKEFPLDLLGRSLAFNPFMPRDIKEHLKKQGRIKEISCEDFAILEEIQNDSEIKAICILTTNLDVEYISSIRRYINLPIIRDDFIIDIYQVLESLVYGADCIVLKAWLLDLKALKELCDYAFHLGLEVLMEIESKEDLTKAVKCGIDIIKVNKNSQNLIPLIPKGKIILDF